MAHTSSPRVTTEELCIIAVIVGAHSQCARRGEDKSRNFRKNDLQIISAGGLRTDVFCRGRDDYVAAVDHSIWLPALLLRVRQSRIGGLQQIKHLRIGRRMFEQPLDGSIDVKHRKAVGNRPARR